MDLRAKVEATIRRHAMFAGGERVLVAVSGGADSVALLHLLTELGPAWRLSLAVLHVDHGLRADSARDAEFVRGVGGRLGVQVDTVRVSVPASGSPEAAARTARYAALEAHAALIGADRIALGHTADDQAETVLMRLLTGAGVRGLAAIPPRRGRIVRPLIDCRHAEMVAALRAAGLPWVEDPSNRDPKFLRNRIRHELLPHLAAAWSPQVVEALARTARLARDTVEALDRLAGRELGRLAVREAGAVLLPRTELLGLPRRIAIEVLRQAAAELGSRGPLRAWGHRRLAHVLATPSPRRPVKLGGVVIEVGSRRIRVGNAPLPALPPRSLEIPGRLALPEAGLVLAARLVPATGYAVPRETRRAAFDADRLGTASLVVRGRRPGERWTPWGGTERTLKEFLIDEKVDRWDRDRVPVVEAGGQILWLAGLRRSAAAPVDERTRTVLELLILPLANEGGGPVQCWLGRP